MSCLQIDWTQIIIHGVGMIFSYFFGKRRGNRSRQIPPLSEKDVDKIDRME